MASRNETTKHIGMIENQYVLAVHDLDRTCEWYERVLGCERFDVEPGNWVHLRVDSVVFRVGRCPDAAAPSDLNEHNYFAYLLVEDADALYEHAKNQQVEFTREPVNEPWGYREFGMRTVDGHRIMIAQKL